MLNAQKAGYKQSRLEFIVNRLVFVVFLFQISICLVLSVLSIDWYERVGEENHFLVEEPTKAELWAKSFFRYFMLLNTLIPISLIVSIEVIKVFQAKFMEWDALMYNKERDKLCKVSSASLNEELGQVEYIFSDKTGTLTRNIMEFKLAYMG